MVRTAKTTTQKKASSASGNKKDSRTLLEDFFIDQLRDIYWAEKHLVKSLPKMQKAATSEELAGALEEHLEATKEHVARLEDIFGMMGETARAKKCEAMEGLVKEGETVIEETEKETATRDAGLIMAAQKVEHYEIATYGGLIQLARTIGRDDVADVLKETMAEEKEADELLTSLAENKINMAAGSETEED